VPLILGKEPGAQFREAARLFITRFDRPSFLDATTKEAVTTQETTQERIMACLRSEPTLTRKLLAQRVGITENGVKYHLDRLRAAGKIRHVGPKKGGRWEVIEERLGGSVHSGDGGGHDS
jgi:ATP-dependent DNA helicase RecG